VNRLVEVAAVVGRDRHRTVLGSRLQQEELDLGMHIAGEPQVFGLGQLTTQHVPAVRPRRGAVGHGDIAEHPRRMMLTGARGPRQHLEGRRIGPRDGIGFRHPGEALDGRAVKSDALLEGAFEFCGRDGHRLQVSEDVGEPQPDEADIAFLQRAQHKFLLAVHAGSLGTGC
jgi:hypothetical protein